MKSISHLIFMIIIIFVFPYVNTEEKWEVEKIIESSFSSASRISTNHFNFFSSNSKYVLSPRLGELQSDLYSHNISSYIIFVDEGGNKTQQEISKKNKKIFNFICLKSTEDKTILVIFVYPNKKGIKIQSFNDMNNIFTNSVIEKGIKAVLEDFQKDLFIEGVENMLVFFRRITASKLQSGSSQLKLKFSLLLGATIITYFVLREIKRYLRKRRCEKIGVLLEKMKTRDIKDIDMCVICLGKLDERDKNIVSLKCHHRFHYGCISRWSQEKESCPICRKNINLKDTNSIIKRILEIHSIIVDQFRQIDFTDVISEEINASEGLIDTIVDAISDFFASGEGVSATW